MSLVHELEESGGQHGLAALCVGVRMGVALAVERV
jgi:3-oxoadipyl-CoA thiolase